MPHACHTHTRTHATHTRHTHTHTHKRHQQTRRFAATLGELTGGRVGLTCGSVGVLKGAITIAVRYSAGRQQFGPPDSPEVCACVPV
jgi:TRAP-type C4-dicarboxylate transport system substrate-binding protein